MKFRVCPACKGTCCVDRAYGNLIEHRTSCAEHVCNHCTDGMAPVLARPLKQVPMPVAAQPPPRSTLPYDWPPAVEEAETWAAVAATYVGGALDAALASYRLRVVCDLEVPTARDFWVRWGLDKETTKLLATPATYENDRRLSALPKRWDGLRNQPSALCRALLALEA